MNRYIYLAISVDANADADANAQWERGIRNMTIPHLITFWRKFTSGEVEFMMTLVKNYSLIEISKRGGARSRRNAVP